MLKDMSLSIHHYLVLEAIKSSGYHSVMVNESSDVSNKNQAVFCVCCVDENLISHEDFMSLCMATVIKEIILQHGLDRECTCSNQPRIIPTDFSLFLITD